MNNYKLVGFVNHKDQKFSLSVTKDDIDYQDVTNSFVVLDLLRNISKPHGDKLKKHMIVSYELLGYSPVLIPKSDMYHNLKAEELIGLPKVS